MANPTQVKNYIAQWMQLGKKVFLNEQAIGTTNVLQGNGYSAEFEQIWTKITAESSRAYLAGTDQSIGNLLEHNWEMLNCVRCNMLSPCVAIGPRETPTCPCADLELWPDLETVTPRSPISNQAQLNQIRDRLSLKQ
ncbi:hypothetical protein Pse7367_0570 [Thalassoporum mexicanum PCC 7367]|uniref:hypothetical protein n=1 Tax=Thalassoporum mexicanum TaxID=3457544 RepID=UPI00029FB550|nr:hypothetical protein [Pseudanabaena sp. PCC 7367]AFY68875.1 hypothetical protein Pse7367_0570 [Pseudanabaena sp. PCC 7367]